MHRKKTWEVSFYDQDIKKKLTSFKTEKLQCFIEIQKKSKPTPAFINISYFHFQSYSFSHIYICMFKNTKQGRPHYQAWLEARGDRIWKLGPAVVQRRSHLFWAANFRRWRNHKGRGRVQAPKYRGQNRLKIWAEKHFERIN